MTTLWPASSNRGLTTLPDDPARRRCSPTPFLRQPQRSPFFALCGSMTNGGQTDNGDLSMDETLFGIRELPSAR
jgi:hypothetical protein